MRRLVLVLTACLLIGIGVIGTQGFAGQAPSSRSSSSERSLSDRYRDFAMAEMRRLSSRTCRLVPRRVLFETFSTVNDPADNNYIALGYAAKVDISPIPLQRAAYNGCARGLRKSDK